MISSLDHTPMACSDCFNDRGLRLEAEQIGADDHSACPCCGSFKGRKLSGESLEDLAYRFFVWGSLSRFEYGAAPLIQFNQYQRTSVDVPPWLAMDVALIERLLGVGFFHYGPRLWMVGEVEPLKALQNTRTRRPTIERILDDYPTVTIDTDFLFYRIRINPDSPCDPSQYDSPPTSRAGKGRLDSPGHPILYGSPDLQLCVHECRAAAEDELYVATLSPNSPLQLLDLSKLLVEDDVTEFESLDMAVHMLFLAGGQAYTFTREIAAAARSVGFHGIVYPSYFSLLRLGIMPFQTSYGISNRLIPQLQQYEQATAIPNLALFGRPIELGGVSVQCINRLLLSRVAYDFRFGPVIRGN